MDFLLYLTVPLIAAFIVFGPIFFIRAPILEKNKTQYYQALADLENDPKNEQLILKAWELGRTYYGSARVTGMVTKFDEAIIHCEIMAYRGTEINGIKV